jgi:hypothetical protein
MSKLLKTLSVMIVIATAGTLAGCELYFGDHGGSTDQWNYCGSDGYYSCSGDNCSWVSPTCPGSGSAECTANTDCAAGCYCASGTCTEAGFCGSNGDCGSGYVCDTSRSSCEPGMVTPPCATNADCAAGTVCNTGTGTCDATCTCQDDTDATNAGYGWCDETRGTCMLGVDPAGTCDAPVTCNTKAPACMDNQVPLVLDNCYTGQCRLIVACEGPTTCSALQHEDDCLARASDCSAVYTGNNCQKSDGSACHAGDTGCTCATFSFNSCSTKSVGMQVTRSSTGSFVDIGAHQ